MMFHFPAPEGTMAVIVDMQGKLLPAICSGETALNRTILLANGLNALGVPMVVTEQYPQGLGPTVPELSALFPEGTPVLSKGTFSCFGAAGFAEALDLAKRPTLIVAGVESHVCVQQTVLEALNRGFQVLLAADAVSSRKSSDMELAIAQMREAGCGVFSVEALLFMLLQSSQHPAFKTISKLVR